ncbi:MAG: poly-beta-hydroxybutyrate polymerase N-terminal domain-containing protein [Rhodomicrobium sp.]
MQKTLTISGENSDAPKLQLPPMDKALHAAIGRVTGGISPAALSLAYTDWLQHLLASFRIGYQDAGAGVAQNSRLAAQMLLQL